MNDLLKAVIGLIIIAILAGAFIAVRSRNSGQTINSVPASPGATTSPGTATSSQPARSVGFSTQQGGTTQGQTAGTTTTTSTTTSTGQTTGTPSASTTTPTVQPGVTPTNQNPTGAGTKPVPALW